MSLLAALEAQRTGPRRVHLDGTQVLIVLTWAAVVGPTLIQSLTAPKYRTAVGESLPSSAIANLANLGLTLGLALLCVVLVVQRLHDLPIEGRGALVVMLLPWIYQVSRDLYVNTTPRLGGLLYPLLVLAVWILRPRLQALGTLGVLIGLTALVSVAMGLLLPAKGLFSSAGGDFIAPDKEILPLGVLIGPFTNGNNLGQFLALGLPAVVFVRSRTLRFAIVAVTVFAVVWTSSRSSIAALVVGVAAALLLFLTPRGARRVVVWVLLTAMAVLVAWLPLTTTRNEAFTNRGYIWRASLGHWADNPWFGLGSQFYSLSARYSNNIGATAYHGHNQFVQVLVLGGLINLALTCALLLVVFRSVARWAEFGRARTPAVVMAMLFTAGALEVSFAFVHRSFLLPVTLLPMAFFVFARPDPPDGEDPVSRSAPRRTPEPAPAPAR